MSPADDLVMLEQRLRALLDEEGAVVAIAELLPCPRGAAAAVAEALGGRDMRLLASDLSDDDERRRHASRGAPARLPRLAGPVRKAPAGVALSPDGTLLASGAVDGEVVLRSLGAAASGSPLRFAGHAGGTYAIAFAMDGRTLATTGADGTVRTSLYAA